MAKAKFVMNEELKKNQDSEDAIADDDNALNYKGVFYNDDAEQKYYEAGAHFPFKELCRRLEKVLRTLSPSRKGKSLYPEEAEGNGLHSNLFDISGTR